MQVCSECEKELDSSNPSAICYITVAFPPNVRLVNYYFCSEEHAKQWTAARVAEGWIEDAGGVLA